MRRERVSEDIFIFTSEMYAQVTASVILTNEGAIVIDTLPFPAESRELAEFVHRRHRRGARYIINTHYHADHVYGNYLFPEAQIISHRLCRQHLAGITDQQLRKIKSDTPGLDDVKLRVPTIVFDNEMGIHLGNRSLRLIHLPGHSPDGIGIYVDGDRILFSGDAVMPLPYFAGGDHDLINSTVRDNAMGQIKLNNGNAAHIGLGKDNEIVSGVGFLKDVVASGPVYGIHNGGTSKMTVLNSVVSKTPVGIMCDSKAQMTLVGVIVQDCSKAMIETNTGNLEIDYSILAPGNNIYQGMVFPAAKFAEWSKKCKVGKNMIYHKTDKIHEVHLFKEGRTKVYVGLRMPKR